MVGLSTTTMASPIDSAPQPAALPISPSCSDPDASCDDWLGRTRWKTTFRNTTLSTLTSLAELPHPGWPLSLPPLFDGEEAEEEESPSETPFADERKILVMLSALDRLFDRCDDTLRHTKLPIRLWLRSTSPHRLRNTSLESIRPEARARRYRDEMKRFLCFWLRAWRLGVKGSEKGWELEGLGGRVIQPSQLQALKELWWDFTWEKEREEGSTCEDVVTEDEAGGEEVVDGAESDEDYVESVAASETEDELLFHRTERRKRVGAEGSAKVPEIPDIQTPLNPDDRPIDVVLRFLLFAIADDEDGTHASLLGYFAAVRGISSDDFLDAHNYTPILARLIHCTRLVVLEGTLPRFAHPHIGLPARPSHDQIQVLDWIRAKKMCRSSASAVGEMIRLRTCIQVTRPRTTPPVSQPPTPNPTTPLQPSSDTNEVLSLDTNEVVPLCPPGKPPKLLVHLVPLNIVVCIPCQQVIYIHSAAHHLHSHSAHAASLRPDHRSALLARLYRLGGRLVASQQRLLPSRLPHGDYAPVPALGAVSDRGNGCLMCPYVCLRREAMRKHCARRHGFVDGVHEAFWRTGVLCQGLHKYGSYLEVDPEKAMMEMEFL